MKAIVSRVAVLDREMFEKELQDFVTDFFSCRENVKEAMLGTFSIPKIAGCGSIKEMLIEADHFLDAWGEMYCDNNNVDAIFCLDITNEGREQTTIIYGFDKYLFDVKNDLVEPLIKDKSDKGSNGEKNIECNNGCPLNTDEG